MSESVNVIELEAQYLLQNYSRHQIVIARGDGSYMWDVNGKPLRLLVPPPGELRQIKGVAPQNRGGNQSYSLSLDRAGRRAVLIRPVASGQGGVENPDQKDPGLLIWDVDRGTLLRHRKLDAHYRAGDRVS